MANEFHERSSMLLCIYKTGVRTANLANSLGDDAKLSSRACVRSILIMHSQLVYVLGCYVMHIHVVRYTANTSQTPVLSIQCSIEDSISVGGN